MGLQFERSAIRVDNYMALKANLDRPEQMIYAKGRRIKLLGMRFWKETPMQVYARELAVQIGSRS